MMKPIILICGVPHSFTSMVTRFLIDNGAYVKETWDDPRWDMKYSRYEDKEIQHYMNQKEKFKNYDLTNYFNEFPKDQVCVIKHPRATFHLDEIGKFTNRKIKIVYVVRNPEQIILSSMAKTSKSFIYYFERLIWMYDFMVSTDLETYALIAERIHKDAPRLLSYCELSTDNIDFKSIKPIKNRKATYFKYRFANFWWKKMSKLFRAL